MNKIIIANMKMNLNYNEIKEYLKNVNKDVIYIPSAIYIPYFIEKNLKCGIQNISIYEEGNHTGEISVLQASSLGIKYVIVSHSEINDSAFNINQKIKLCLKYNLTPILCIGEKLKTDDIKNVIINKLDNYLKDITDINKIIFAYEPEWIIGKNDSVDIKIVDDIISFIKKFLYQKYKISDIMVLYGGSINSYNVKEIINIPYIDGILVGNNSTNIEEFSKIIEVALS
mgnify:CR=1 FL=1